MSKTTLQLRRGSTTDNASFTGALGEVVVDTTLKTLVVHDGSTLGGNYVAPLVSPALTGIPTAPTATSGTNTTQLATTAFVSTAIAAGLPTISIGANFSASGSGAISYSGGVLRYTPPDLTGYLTSAGVTSSLITTALGYTPYNGSTNPNGFLTSGSITGSLSVQSSVPSGALTYNSGTGQFNFTAPVQSVNSLTGVVNLTTDNVPVGGSSNNLYLNLSSLSNTLTSGAVAGAIVSGATGATIAGDFSNATVANRTVFSTTATNSATGIFATPNGTNRSASWQAANSSILTNASKIAIATNGTTDVQLVSGINGSGTYLPLTFYNNGAEQMRLTPTGFFGVGQSNPQYKLDVAGDINVTGAVRTQGAAGVNGQILQSTGTGATWASISSSLPNVTELDSIASVKTASAAIASIAGTTMSVTGGMLFGNFIVGMNLTNNNLPTTLVQSGNQVQTTSFTASVAPGSGIYSGYGVLSVTSIPTNYGITAGMAITGGSIPAGATITGNISGTGNSLNSTWTISASVTQSATTLVATTGSTTFTGSITGNQLLVVTSPTGLGIYPGMVLTGGLIPQAGTTNQVTISMIANFIGTTTATYVSGTIPTLGMLVSGTNVPNGTYVTAVSGSQGTQLKNVAIVGVFGQCTFNPLSFVPQVGQPVAVAGIAPNGSTIQGYSNPTTYYVSASPIPTTTSFTLTDSIANAYAASNNLTTQVTASTLLSGVLTFTANTTFTVSNPVTSQYSISVTGITYTQGYNISVLGVNNGASGTNAVINSSTMQVLGSTTGTYAGNLASAIFTYSGISVSTAASYFDVTQVATSGGGGGAVFDFVKSGSGTAYSGNLEVNVVNPGNGYQVGDTITIAGTSLGGGAPAQNLIMTVALVTGFTQGMLLTGTGVTPGTSISLVNAAQFVATLNGTNQLSVTQYNGSVLTSVVYASASTIGFTATTVSIPAGTVITVLGIPTGSMTINSVILTAGQNYYIGAVNSGGTTASLYATAQNAITSTSPLAISNGTTTGAQFSFAGSTFGNILQNMVVSGVGIPNGTYITSGNGIFPIVLSQAVFSSNGLPIVVTALSYSIAPSQSVISTTVSGTDTGDGSTWTLSATSTSPTSTLLTTVKIVGTAGQFTCDTTAYPMVIGMRVTITGLFGGTGTIVTPAYATGTVYYIIATNGYTAFTLSRINGGSPLVTTAGTPSGLIYTLNRAVITGGLATVNFDPQLGVPYTVGSTVTVNGITPIGYNGIYTVLAATNSSVSYANPTAGNQTAAGTVGANIAVPTTIIGVNNATTVNTTINNGGSGAGNILTVGSVTSGTITPGMVLSGGTTTAGTTVVSQLTSSSPASATTSLYQTAGTLVSGGVSGTNTFVTQLGATTSIADVGNYVSGIGIPVGTQVTTVNNDSIVTLAATTATTTATQLNSPAIIDNAGTVQFNQILNNVRWASATTIAFDALATPITAGTGINIIGTGIGISATMTIGGLAIANAETYYVGAPSTTTSITLYANYAASLAGGSGASITYGTLTVAGTGGQFTISSAQGAGTFKVGNIITLTGNPIGIGGSISGFQSGNTYVISATNGTNAFTLSGLNNAPIVTTTGTITGFTMVLGGPLGIASPIILTSDLYGTLTILNTSGQFSFSTAQGATQASNYFNVGNVIIITGTPSNGLAITGYSTGTAYKISATNGSSVFTLTTLTGVAVTTQTGVTSGLSFNVITTTGASFQTMTPFTPTVGQSITLSGTNTNTSTNVLTGIGITNNTGVFTCTSNTIYNNTAVIVTGTNTNSVAQSLTGVSVSGVNGTFQNTSATLQVGQTVTISGNATNATTALGSVIIGSSQGTFTCSNTVLLPNQQVIVTGTMTSPNTLSGAQVLSTTGVFSFANTLKNPVNSVQLITNQTVTVSGTATAIAIASPVITGTQGQFNIGTTLGTPSMSSASGALTGQVTLGTSTSGLTVGQPVQVLGSNAGVGVTITFSSITGGRLVVSSTGTTLATGTALVISTATSISGNIAVGGVALSSIVASGVPVIYYVGSPSDTTNLTLYGTLATALTNTSPLTVTGSTATGAVFNTLPGTFVNNSGNTIANSLYYISATNTTSTFTITDSLSNAFNQVLVVNNTSSGPTQFSLGTVSFSNSTTIGFSVATASPIAVGTPFYVAATTSPSATIGGVLVAVGQIYYMGNATTNTSQLFATYQNAINNTNALIISNATFGSSTTFLAGQVFVSGTNLAIGQAVQISGTFGAATTISGTTTFSNTTGGLTLGTPTAAGALQPGQLVKVSGTQSGGTITGYVDPTNYLITATNGSSTLTLANPTGYVLPTITGTAATTIATAQYGTLTTTSTSGAFSISSAQAAGTFYNGAVITATGSLNSSVSITGTISIAVTNQLGFSNVPTFTLGTATTLTVGQAVTISGTFSQGSITGYITTGTTYYIISTNGTTTFTLSATQGGTPVVATGSGAITGLTLTTPPLVNYFPGTRYVVTATNTTSTFTLVDLNTSLALVTYNTQTVTGLTFSIVAPIATANNIQFIGSTGVGTGTALASVAYSSATVISFTATFAPIPAGTPVYLYGANIGFFVGGVSAANAQVYYLGQTTTTTASLYASAVNAINNISALTISNSSTVGVTFLVNQFVIQGTQVTISGASISGNLTVGGVALAASQVYFLGNVTPYSAQLFSSYVSAIGGQNPLAITGSTTTGATFTTNAPSAITTIAQAVTGITFAVTPQIVGYSTPSTYYVMNTNGGTNMQLTSSLANALVSNPVLISGLGATSGLTTTATPSTITGYSSGTTYYIATTNGSTQATLSATPLITLNNVQYASASTISFTATGYTLTVGMPLSFSNPGIAGTLQIGGITIASGQVYYIGAPFTSTSATLYASASNASTSSSPLSITAGTANGTFTLGGVPVVTTFGNAYAGLTYTLNSIATYPGSSTTYYIGTTNGYNTFTLSTGPNGLGQLITAQGIPTGLTFSAVPQFISGYSSPSSYYITATNTTTQFTLSGTPGGPAIATVVGTPTGLSYSISAPSLLGYSPGATYYITSTNGTNGFTLSSQPQSTPLSTTAGIPTGLVFTVQAPLITPTYSSPTTYYIASTNGTNLAQLSLSNPAVSTILGLTLTSVAYSSSTQISFASTGSALAAGTLISLRGTSITGNMTIGTVGIAASQTYFLGNTTTTSASLFSTYANAIANTGPLTISNGTTTGAIFTASQGIVTQGSSTTISFPTTGTALQNGTIVTISGNNISGTMTIGGVALLTSQTYYMGNVSTTSASLFATFSGAVANSGALTISSGTTVGAQFTASGGAPISTVPGTLTGVTMTAYVATLTYAFQSVSPFPAGGAIQITGFSAQPAFNGNWVVQSSNSTTIVVAIYTTTALTGSVMGNITGASSLYMTVTLSNNLTTTASGTYAFYDGGAAGSNSFGITTSSNLAVGQLISGTGIPTGTTILALLNMVDANNVPTNIGVVLSNNLTTQATGTYNAYNVGGAGTYTVSGSTQLVTSTAMAAQSFTVTPSQTVAGTILDGTTASINGGNTIFTPTNNSASVAIVNPIQILLIKNGARLTGWLNKSRPVWNTITKYGDYTINSSGQIVFTSPPQVGDIVASTVLVGNSTNPLVAYYPFNAVDVVTGT